jgi:hypothetical protein
LSEQDWDLHGRGHARFIGQKKVENSFCRARATAAGAAAQSHCVRRRLMPAPVDWRKHREEPAAVEEAQRAGRESAVCPPFDEHATLMDEEAASMMYRVSWCRHFCLGYHCRLPTWGVVKCSR